MSDVYVNAKIEAGETARAHRATGKKVITMTQTFETAAADAAADIRRVFANVNPHLIPISAKIYNDAIAGATDLDLGLYDPEFNGGAVIDKDVLDDGLDISGGNAVTSPQIGLTEVDLADLGQKSLYELAGRTIDQIKGGIDIALTLNSDISAVGTITVVMKFLEQN